MLREAEHGKLQKLIRASSPPLEGLGEEIDPDIKSG